MRIGLVRGHVVLCAAVPELRGSRLLVVEPVTAENLSQQVTRGGGKSLIVADHLAPARGQLIGFVEGREAANPYYPGNVPVDAYCSLIIDRVEYHPPVQAKKDSK